MTLRLITGGRSSPVSSPLFDSFLDRNGRRQLEGVTVFFDVDEGRVLAKEGEACQEILVVAEGIVKLWKTLSNGRQQIVAFRGPGDLVTLHRHDTPWPVNA